MDQILACFERYFSKRQFPSLLFVLNLLLASQKKLLSRAEGKSESAFSRFFGVYVGDRKAVEAARLKEHWAQGEAYTRQHRVRRMTLRLSIDDTVVPKSGKAFDRLGIHYSSTLDKEVAGHCFVVLDAAIGPFQFPGGVRWYVNEAFCSEAQLTFKTKLTLAVELLEELTLPSMLPIRTVEVLLDGGYAEKEVLDYVIAQGWHFYARLASNRTLEEIQVVGRAGKPYTKKLSQVKSGDVVTPSYLGEKVKVVRQRGKKGPRYLMTNCLTASNSKVRKRAKLRWEVEVFFRRIKHHLGFGEYRVRRWQAIEKYILIVWIASMITCSESPPSVEGVLVTLEEHQQALAWQILHITMKDYLLAKLILLKIVLDHLLVPLLL